MKAQDLIKSTDDTKAPMAAATTKRVLNPVSILYMFLLLCGLTVKQLVVTLFILFRLGLLLFLWDWWGIKMKCFLKP
jgi:hypothetical protein